MGCCQELRSAKAIKQMTSAAEAFKTRFPHRATGEVFPARNGLGGLVAHRCPCLGAAAVAERPNVPTCSHGFRTLLPSALPPLARCHPPYKQERPVPCPRRPPVCVSASREQWRKAALEPDVSLEKQHPHLNLLQHLHPDSVAVLVSRLGSRQTPPDCQSRLVVEPPWRGALYRCPAFLGFLGTERRACLPRQLPAGLCRVVLTRWQTSPADTSRSLYRVPGGCGQHAAATPSGLESAPSAQPPR